VIRLEEKKEETPEEDEEGVPVSSRFLMLLFFGFALVIVGVIVVIVAAVISGGSGSFGGVIFIGPFPIVFGAGPDGVWLVTTAIVIAVLSIVVFLIMRRRSLSV